MRVEDSISHQWDKVNFGQLEWLCLVKWGECKQVIDQFLESNRFLLDPLHGLCDFFGLSKSAHSVEFGVTPYRDKRCAKLERSIHHKPSYVVGREKSITEGTVNGGEHCVERAIESSNLGVERGSIKALTEIT